MCNKTFTCGQPSDPHRCQSKCHNGICPTCPLTTVVKCRCGYMDREIACKKVTSKADDARCEKKCTKVGVNFRSTSSFPNILYMFLDATLLQTQMQSALLY